MRFIKLVSVISLISTLSGCATTAALDQGMIKRGVALVKDSVFVPAFSPSNATLETIDGKKTAFFSSSHKIPAGSHLLGTSCTYFIGVVAEFYGNNEINADLVAGHTYKLIPVLPRVNTGKCKSVIEDETATDKAPQPTAPTTAQSGNG